MAKAKNKVGRPFTIADQDVVFLAAREAKSKLQESSDRRAIVNRIVDAGGKATVKELNDAFGYDVRATILALIKVRWLQVEAKAAT